MQLTIGMPSFKDFNGTYFSVQALRLYQDLTDTELLVIDNFGCPTTKNFCASAGVRYILYKDVVGPANAKDRVFQEAKGEAVLCMDCHVLFLPNTITRLKKYYQDNPNCLDLLQGPLVYDDLKNTSSHFEPVWRGHMWGVWANDPRAKEDKPFPIPMQGMGVFSCRKAAWLGFNPKFRGFGGEEGYIHEKFRQAGRQTLCLPWLKWVHRFGRPDGVPFPLKVEDKIRNYVIGFTELKLPLQPIFDHFKQSISEDVIHRAASSAFTQSAPSPQKK